MSNTNNNLQTQTSRALYNAIMETCCKDRPPILAPGNYVQWKSRIKRYIDTKPNNELIYYYLQNPPYIFKWTEKTVPIAEAKVVQIILTWIDNYIYSIVDACPNACEMWKAIKRSQQAATRNRGKAIVNSPPPTYDQEPEMVAEDDALSKEKEIDKLIALIFLSFKKIYKPTNNNLRTSSNTSRAHQDNTPRINKGTRYDNQRVVNVAGARENIGTQVVQQSRIQCYNYKEYGHVAKECQKPKRAKDATYHNEKMLFCTVKFGNDQIALIHGYGVLVQGNSTCYIRDLKRNDLPTGFYGTDMYSITLQDTSTPNPICLMAKATSSQAWLWHRRLSHLNFDTINLISKYDIVTDLPKLKLVKDHLCSSCELGKSKRKYFKTKTTPSSKRRLRILHMDLCGLMRVESFNGKKYVLVIVDDCSRYTWTHFLRSKDETPEVLIDFLTLVQRGLHAQVRTVRTDKGTVVERRNRTLVEAARTMLSAAKVLFFFWVEAIATTCFTQNRSLVIPQHEKTPYHIINGQKPSVKFFHIFGSLCYIVNDGENLDKMKEKGDACIFIGYSTQSGAYRVYNKRTKVIVKTIHVNFDELPQMASDHVSSDSVPQSETVTMSNELDLLFSLMFDELLNGTTPVVSKSSVVTATDAPNQHHQQNTTPSTSTTVFADIPSLNIQTTPETTNQEPTQAPTITAIENINQV
ncbi:retrovirus-related pol polyprotein from transposon TNT 1-94 [Tanacetum coccineum]